MCSFGKSTIVRMTISSRVITPSQADLKAQLHNVNQLLQNLFQAARRAGPVFWLYSSLHSG
jgi:hypothetical protein